MIVQGLGDDHKIAACLADGNGATPRCRLRVGRTTTSRLDQAAGMSVVGVTFVNPRKTYAERLVSSQRDMLS